MSRVYGLQISELRALRAHVSAQVVGLRMFGSAQPSSPSLR